MNHPNNKKKRSWRSWKHLSPLKYASEVLFFGVTEDLHAWTDMCERVWSGLFGLSGPRDYPSGTTLSTNNTAGFLKLISTTSIPVLSGSPFLEDTRVYNGFEVWRRSDQRSGDEASLAAASVCSFSGIPQRPDTQQHNYSKIPCLQRPRSI